jgi:imidazolonepropionase
MKVYRGFSEILTLHGAYQKNGRRLRPADLSVIPQGSIVFSPDEIIWVGPDKELPIKYKRLPAKFFKNKVLLPEVVDSHTHLLFAGNRAHEYIMRLNGATYEEIAARGGGILYTCEQTAKTSPAKLFKIGFERIEHMAALGVGTIEIKSGYGLDYKKELILSRTIGRLKKYFHPRIQIINTFMAAHAVPKIFKNSTEYLVKVVLPLLKTLAQEKTIDFVDIFHEQNYFNTQDVEILFNLASQLGLPTKCHIDELNDNGGAKMAVKLGCLSCEHLLKTNDEGIQSLAHSSIIATVLPGTSFFMGKNLAPVRAMLDAGVRLAIASDFNPGSCHFDNLVLIASMAAPQYKMNLAELVSAITLNAAHAVNLTNQGAIVPGLRPRFSCFSAANHEEIFYSWGKKLATPL